MLIVESWLRSQVNPALEISAIADCLTMAGLEVEDQTTVAHAFTGVVVGEVLSVEPHPNADRLRVCQVNVGEATPLTIVCGAPNVTPNMKVPCARIGAKIPLDNGEILNIKLGKLRGVESHGMLCSAKELGLTQNQDGLLPLNADAPVGTDIRQYLDLDDTILEIKLTPNRADCLSVRGIAREVAALTNTPLITQEAPSVAIGSSKRLPVRIIEPTLCGRFSGRVIEGVNAKAKTPNWMVNRLERAGQRSVSALVDISNYVMIEIGHPNHIFDLDKLTGDLTIRFAQAEEEAILLNGKTVRLQSDVGVISDQTGIQSLAGIMGGMHSATSDDTRNVYVEAAFWWPLSIQGRCKRFGFTTDAAHRFERGVDPQNTVYAIEYLTELILAICGGTACVIDDQIINIPTVRPVKMRLSRARKITGIDFTENEVIDIFNRLEFSWDKNGDVFTVTAPSRRFDIEREEDLIEEVLRLYGYDNIPARAPIAPQQFLPVPDHVRSAHDLRHLLKAKGYHETVHYSFVPEAWEQQFSEKALTIKLLNPISENMAVMRSQHLASHLHTLIYNLNHKVDRVRTFEIAKVFQKDQTVTDDAWQLKGIKQTWHLSLSAYGFALPEQWGTQNRWVDFFDVKQDIENMLVGRNIRFEKTSHPVFHPGRGANIVLEDQIIGVIGELHPQLLKQYDLPKAPVLAELQLEPFLNLATTQYQALPKILPVTRDIAVICKQSVSMNTFNQIFKKISNECLNKNIVLSFALFDEYRPSEGSAEIEKDEKSLCFRVNIQSKTETLTDESISIIINSIVDNLKHKIGVRLRGNN